MASRYQASRRRSFWRGLLIALLVQAFCLGWLALNAFAGSITG